MEKLLISLFIILLLCFGCERPIQTGMVQRKELNATYWVIVEYKYKNSNYSINIPLTKEQFDSIKPGDVIKWDGMSHYVGNQTAEFVK